MHTICMLASYAGVHAVIYILCLNFVEANNFFLDYKMQRKESVRLRYKTIKLLLLRVRCVLYYIICVSIAVGGPVGNIGT